MLNHDSSHTDDPHTGSDRATSRDDGPQAESAQDEGTRAPTRPTAHDWEQFDRLERHSQFIVAEGMTAWDAGLTVTATRDDGSKAPAGKWAELIGQRPSREATAARLRGKHGMGIVFGDVYRPDGTVADHGVILFEFDDAKVYEDFLAKLPEAPAVAATIELIRNGYEEETPAGGVHLLLYTEDVGSNEKLAQRAKRDDERRRLTDGSLDPDDVLKTTIETRERGGFGVTYPSAFHTHASGKPYVRKRGGFDQIATITAEQWRELREFARTFDETPMRSRQQQRDKKRREGKPPPDGRATSQRPGDAYNRSTTWEELLTSRGWTRVRTDDADVAYWRRPGAATAGHDATVNADGTDRLFVHSSSVAGLEAGRYFTKFAFFAHVEHGGDFTAAAAALRAEGFGGTGGEGVVRSLNADDFFAHLPDHSYIHRPTRKHWVKAGVDSAIAPICVGTGDDGEPKYIRASQWLDQHRAVHQEVWAPGLDETVDGWLMNEGGWREHPGTALYNLYQPPTIPHGDAGAAGPWIDHIVRIYPDDAQHIIRWFAQRVQDPATKINHALVLGGVPGIGKDTLLAPVAHAVGPWNMQDVSPSQVVGRFNRFLRSVLLRISEARDLGDVNRYGFYEAMKPLEAAPPETLLVDEKFLSPYYVWNCCGVVYTTNNRTTGLYLPADDRRHFVTWSDAQPSDFEPGYFTRLYEWFGKGGNGHVAAYLAALDLSDFDPKAPPLKTPAFWSMVDANRAPEESDLADLIDAVGNPPAITLAGICKQASPYGDPLPNDLVSWLQDRRHARQVPHRLESVGYVAVRNDCAKSGLWVIEKRRQVVYARAELSRRDQLVAAQALTGQ